MVWSVWIMEKKLANLTLKCLCKDGAWTKDYRLTSSGKRRLLKRALRVAKTFWRSSLRNISHSLLSYHSEEKEGHECIGSLAPREKLRLCLILYPAPAMDECK